MDKLPFDFFKNLGTIILEERGRVILKEADGCWCACWTSNPDVLRKGDGRFDSYTPPPYFFVTEGNLLVFLTEHPHFTTFYRDVVGVEIDQQRQDISAARLEHIPELKYFDFFVFL